jgi:hypothetical protein
MIGGSVGPAEGIVYQAVTGIRLPGLHDRFTASKMELFTEVSAADH